MRQESARRSVGGFTLIELMIVVAIIGLLATIAMPVYNNYISDSETTVLVTNVRSMQLFQDDYLLREGTYAAGTYDAEQNITTLTNLIDWDPRSDNVVYTVTLLNEGAGYRVVAESATGAVICRDYPGDTNVTPCPP